VKIHNNNSNRASVWLWTKLFRLAMRALNVRSEWFVTSHYRPKYVADIGTWSDPASPAPNVAVLLQGPLVHNEQFTLNTVQLYQQLFPACQLIVSTWEGEDTRAVSAMRRLGVEVLQSKLPEHPGPLNVNYQITSAKKGVERAGELGCEFVLKTRCDLRIYAPNVAEFLCNLTDAFPLRTDYDQRRRIVSVSRNTMKFCPYCVSDMVVFGHIDDMMTFWSAPHRSDVLPDGYRDVLGQIARYKSPESYLTSRYLEQIGRGVVWSLEDSWQALADHFCIVDWESLDIYWPKYAPHNEYFGRNYQAVTSSQLVDFCEWLSLYQGLTNDEALRHSEQILELELGQPLSGASPGKPDCRSGKAA